MKKQTRGLLFSLLVLSSWQATASENIVFPPESGLVDVKEKYGAKGDGVTDDTDSIQRAIFENKGKPGTLYFPNGTYLVSRTLFTGGEDFSREPIRSKAHSSDRFLSYQGQSEAGTVIRLKDNAEGFANPEESKVVLSLYHGGGTGDAMHAYVRNLTIDVGSGNPGAVGLRYLSNNTGGIYNLTVRSSDPERKGSIGLDLRQGQQGPALIRNVTVEGFDTGVETADTFSLVFEHLTLRHQNKVGFHSPHGRITIRGLKSENKVTAVHSGKDDVLTLIDSHFTGGSPDQTAVIVDGKKNYLRSLQQSGYGAILRDASGTETPGAELDEWTEGGGKGLFTTEIQSLRLPVKESPVVPWEQDLSKWVVLDDSEKDDTASIQRQIDEAAAAGKTTIAFKQGERKYQISGPIRIHGSINRLIGMESVIDVSDPDGVFDKGKAVFTVEDIKSPVFVVERFFGLGGWKAPNHIPFFENKSKAVFLIQSVGMTGAVKTAKDTGGEWFLDDVSPGRNGTLLIGKNEKVWARQYNPESYKSDMIRVDGGQLWLLGLKTEGRTSHLIAENGANVEIIGSVSYQSWDKQELDPPMFTIKDSRASISIGIYSSRFHFTTIVEEIHKGETKTLARTELDNWHLGLYRSGVKEIVIGARCSRTTGPGPREPACVYNIHPALVSHISPNLYEPCQLFQCVTGAGNPL